MKCEEEEEEDPGEEKWAAFLERCHINPDLFMLKVTLFVMYGATASLLPYLTIHMQSIGLTVEEIAIVYLALPFTTFLSPPVTGYLVDKFGQYKPVVIFSLILNAICHHSLMLIPHMEMPGEMPAAYVMRHPETEKVEVWWSPCPSRECPEEEELDMVLASCLDHCLVAERREDPEVVPKAVFVPPPATPSCVCPGVAIPNLDSQGSTQKPLHFLMEVDGKKQKKKKKPSKRKPQQAISRPATGLDPPGSTKNGSEDNPAAYFFLDMHPSLGDPVEQLGIEMEPDDNDTVDFRQSFGENLLREARVNLTALEEEDLRCGGLVLATNLTKNTLKELTADCILQKCSFRDGGPEVCPPDYKESDDRIFWIYFLLRFVGTTMLTAGVTMLDPIALTMIQRYGGEFGRERLFSSLGMAIFSPLTGLLIDHNSQTLGYTDYSAAFYTYDVLLVISAVTVGLLPLQAKLPADHIMRDLMRIIRLPHVILFILFLFLLGNFWGFIESFLFLYLKELGAPNYLLGVTVTVGTISSMPFLYGAGKIINKLGHVNIIVVAFFSHAARLIGYSFIESPWWCFPFEAIESLAVHLMWIAAATYCTLLAPKTLLATLIGILGMSHFSLGRGSGSFLGGFLIGTVGTRESFRLMGVLAIAGGLAYGVLHRFWLRHEERRNKVVTVIPAASANTTEAGDFDPLRGECAEEAAEPSMSIERLSLIIKMNHRGSLTSLDPELNQRSRRGSNSKINPQLDRKNSTPYLNSTRKEYLTPQLGHKNLNTPKSSIKNLPSPVVSTLVVDEVRIRRDSIPEEDEVEDFPHRVPRISVPDDDDGDEVLKQVLGRKSWHDNNESQA